MQPEPHCTTIGVAREGTSYSTTRALRSRCGGPACIFAADVRSWARGAVLPSIACFRDQVAENHDVTGSTGLTPRGTGPIHTYITEADLRSKPTRESTPQHGTPADRAP